MENFKLGSYENTILNMLGSPFRSILGAGGYGTVITTEEYPNLALKISHEIDICPSWGKEYNIQKRIYTAYDSTGKSVRVVEPLEFAYIEGDRCYILMQRVCAPIGDVAIHALLGEINRDDVDEKRGRFVGQEFLKGYVDLERVAVDLGIFLATVHFKLQLDGKDLEYILGKRCGTDKKYWINVIDFGMVADYTKEGAIASIDTVFYFPLRSTCDYYKCTPEQTKYNKVLSALFAHSYIFEADKYGMAEEAAEIIEVVSE